MALALNDRVQQTGTANTTVSFTLSGAVTGFQSFAVIGNGNTTYYAATDGAGNWEVGEGTYSTTGPTLSRTTILSSSNSGSAVTFSGAVTVFVTYPSSKAVFEDASGNVSPLGTITSGTWQGSTIGTAYGGTGVTSSSGPNSVVLRDANGNVTGVNNAIIGITFITSAGGTTNLVVSSTQIQTVVGSANQTIRLPDATTLAVGQFYTISCASSGTVTVEDFAGGIIETITQGGASQVLCSSTATVAGTWGFRVFAASNVTWGNAALDYNGLITSATWQGDTVQSGYGGTGLTTFASANNALYSTSASALAAGTLPVAAGGTGLTSLTADYIPYGNGTGAYQSVSTFTFNGTTLATPSASLSGNLTFTGTGNRITGDFSTATASSRVLFQSSTTNGDTYVGAIPNGTSTFSALFLRNSSDADNASSLSLVLSSSLASITSNLVGTGTYLPMSFNTGGSERVRIATTGAIGLSGANYGTASTQAIVSNGSATAPTWQTIVTPSATQTLTNKRVNPRVLASTANVAEPVLNTDDYDAMVITGQSVAITSFTTNLTGTPVNGQKLWISITGTTAIAITWGASFESSTITLPTTTVLTDRLDVGFVWNVATTKWRCVGAA